MNNETYSLKLFVSGMSVKSARAVENLKKITEEYLKENSKIEIIDISQFPEKAKEYQIFAIPTLIKENPEPIRFIIGDLSDREKVLKLLEIK